MRRSAVAIAAIAALLGAGSATAASRWLITSINQIKPSVRAQLRGHQGPRGFTGAQGPTGPQGSQGPQGLAGATGTAQAVAVVNDDGTLLQGVGFPKNVTGVSHTPNSGIYCIRLAGAIDPADAMATLTDDSDAGAQVDTVRNSTDCATGEAEVNTFQLQQSGTTTAGTPLQEVFDDEGFVIIVP